MRGKVLGGSSSINVMAYTRGNRGDYDRWAQKGARGWSYADVLPYFNRAETWENGADTWRGGEGPLGTQFAKTPDPIFDAWLEAAQQSGYPFTEDYNGKQQEGFGRGQYTIRDGRRSSTSRAYLRPARGGTASRSKPTRMRRGSSSRARVRPVLNTSRTQATSGGLKRKKSSSRAARSTRRNS